MWCQPTLHNIHIIHTSLVKRPLKLYYTLNQTVSNHRSKAQRSTLSTQQAVGCLPVADDRDCLIKSIAGRFASCYPITIPHAARQPKQSRELIRWEDFWIKGTDWSTWLGAVSSQLISGRRWTNWSGADSFIILSSLLQKKKTQPLEQHVLQEDRASFSPWGAVWKHADYPWNMNISLFWSVSLVVWQGHSRQESTTLSLRRLFTQQRLMKATQLVR